MFDLDVETTQCICGSEQWKLWASFDTSTREISAFSLEMYCLNCGSKAKTPIPVI